VRCREYRHDDFIGNLIGNICVIFSWQLMDYHYLFTFRTEDCNTLSTVLLIYSNTEKWKPSNSIINVLLCGCYVYVFVCVHALNLINIICLYINSALQLKTKTQHHVSVHQLSIIIIMMMLTTTTTKNSSKIEVIPCL